MTKLRGLCLHSWSLLNQIGLRERTNSTMTAGPSTRKHLLISASGMVAEGKKSLLDIQNAVHLYSITDDYCYAMHKEAIKKLLKILEQVHFA